jgi:3-hydroxyisobutyrate dehydrogenase-like beta-hydroxyacid dehydrogenase
MRVGFVGLGSMGSSMSLRLLDRGWNLTVYDLRDEALAETAKAGAIVARDLSSVGETCDVVCVMVWNDEQLLDLAVGPHGLVDSCRPGALLVIHSTVLPRTVLQVAEAAERHEVKVIDAPVSGGAAGRARTGELTIMVGGDQHDVERARPVLDSLAAHVFHVGPLGDGLVAKIANNTMSIGNLLFALEALRYATAAGLDPLTVLELATVSSGQSYALDNLRSTLELLVRKRSAGNEMLYEAFSKDLFLTVLAGREQHLHLPLTALAASLSPDLVRAAEQSIGDELLAAVDSS